MTARWWMLAVLGAVLCCASVEAQRRPAQARPACRATSPRAASPVLRVLSAQATVGFRREHGLTGVNARELRPLTDARSAAVCQRLNALYRTSMYGRAPWQRTYFEAGGFYFASIVDGTNPRTGRPRAGHVAVFDASLRPLAIWSHR